MKKWILVAFLLSFVGCFGWEEFHTNGPSESDKFVAADDVSSLSVVEILKEKLNAAFVGTKEDGFVILCVEPDVNEELLTPSVVFLDAGLKGVRIFADKELFGHRSGENIAEYFKVVNAYGNKYRWPWSVYQGLKTATLNVPVSEWNRDFVPHVQCRDFWIQFAEQPTERYDEVTFTVSMDILLSDGGERTLTGSVKVAFE